MSTPARKPQFGDRVHVVPAPGKIIRHETTGAVLPPEGATAVYSSFWARRVGERAVVVQPSDSSPAIPESDANPQQPGELGEPGYVTADGGPAPEGYATPTISDDDLARMAERGVTITPIATES